MTARHATALPAVEWNSAAGTREIILRDQTGLARRELIADARPSQAVPGYSTLNLEAATGIECSLLDAELSPTQLRALAAFLLAAAADAEKVR